MRLSPGFVPADRAPEDAAGRLVQCIVRAHAAWARERCYVVISFRLFLKAGCMTETNVRGKHVQILSK